MPCTSPSEIQVHISFQYYIRYYIFRYFPTVFISAVAVYGLQLGFYMNYNYDMKNNFQEAL